MAFPMGRMFHMSLFQDLFSRVEEQFVGFDNYANLFQKELFWIALKNSIIFVAASLVIHQIVGGGLALLLTARMRGPLRAFFRAIFITPWLIIPAVVAITWVLLLDHRGGFNSTLRTLGIVECCPPPEWFGDFNPCHAGAYRHEWLGRLSPDDDHVAGGIAEHSQRPLRSGLG